MLSRLPTTMVHTRTNVPHPVSPLQYSQITTGTSTGERDADAAKYRLYDRGHHHAEGHAADRQAGQQDRLLAAFARESVSETLRGSGSAFTADIHDGRD